jgi:hypothetical protein
MEGGVGMTSVYTFDLLQGSSRVGCTKTVLRPSRRGNFDGEEKEAISKKKKPS